MKRHDYLLIALLLLVLALRFIPGGGALYANRIYPIIGGVLGWCSSWIFFSISDVFYVVGIAFLIVYPFLAVRKYHRTKKEAAVWEVRMIVWLYVWFNLAWGINYMAPDLYKRTSTSPVKYDVRKLKTFAYDYLNKLNDSYCDIDTIDEAKVSRETVAAYRRLSKGLGIHEPFSSNPRSKTMLLTPLYSKVGVLGSMGPFFGEFTLNGDLLPSQYPACWAHEYAHSLGIAREGEAEFYSFLACSLSTDSQIRFSGYMSILSYVLRALYNIDERTGDEFFAHIRPEIRQLYIERRTYWQARYSSVIGNIQNVLLDSYLKSNSVKGGIQNYSEVVGLLMTLNYQK